MMPKRRIALSNSKRLAPSAFILCGDCQQNCTAASGQCDKCQLWYHYKCEKLTTGDSDSFQGFTNFTCFKCLKKEVGPSYSYPTALLRLTRASKHGYQSLICAARHESIVIGENTLPEPVKIQHKDFENDSLSYLILEKHSMTEAGHPLSVSEDGNCLFSSISIALYGHEQYSTQIRVRTCLQMCLNPNLYTLQSTAVEISLLSPSYEESCIDCAQNGQYSSAWTMMAAADAIGITIRSVYPPCNGCHDLAYQMLNTEFKPVTVSQHAALTLMWTCTELQQGLWMPNHFVPLITEDEPQEPMEQNGMQYTDFNNKQDEAELGKPKKAEALEPKVSVQNSNTLSHNFGIVKDEMATEASGLQKADVDQSSITKAVLNHENDSGEDLVKSNGGIGKSKDVPTLKPIPIGGLSTDMIYAELSKDQPIFKDIPLGKKDNMYLIFDNTANVKRKKNDQHNVFWDDLGTWDSKKGTTTKTYRILSKGQKTVYLKDNLFCSTKMVRKKRIFVPVVPQPEKDDILVLNRYYTALKRQSNFRKRVTWFSYSKNPLLANKALIEYNGELQELATYHGNSKKCKHTYRRTKPKHMEHAALELKKKKPRIVFKEMTSQNDLVAPKESQPQRKLKYRQRVKNENFDADEILSILRMVNEHPFVQQVQFTKAQMPSVILYCKEQLIDLNHCMLEELRVGIDRTFNMGNYCVTYFVYKNMRVVHKKSNDHPVFLGPVFLHKETSFEKYHFLLSHIRAILGNNISHIDVMLPAGDDEKCLTQAIAICFPNAKYSLCTKHLKNKISSHVNQSIGRNKKDKQDTRDKVSAKDGEINNDVTCQSEEQSVFLSEIHDTETQTTGQQSLNKKPKMELNPGNSGKLGNWTSNTDNFPKMDADWEPCNISVLISIMSDMINLQLVDLRRALCNSGNYRLFGYYKKYYIREKIFHAKTSEEQSEIFMNFLKDIGGIKNKDLTIESSLEEEKSTKEQTN